MKSALVPLMIIPMLAVHGPSHADHPLPSYDGYSEAQLEDMAATVRKSRPTMHRGGWEWDRLLSRYLDGDRKETGALPILHAYFLSILDRYYEAEAAGEGEAFNLFPGHGAWGSGGRLRIYAETCPSESTSAGRTRDIQEDRQSKLEVGL